jgi:shikimate kinase
MSAGPGRRIVLVGFMGAGKSTVGRELARVLGWSFLDMDRRIEQVAGLSVAQIFRQHGEAAFRRAETELAREVAGLERVVVAAGGGAFAAADTRAALQAGAFTVWLRSDLPTLLARLPGDGSRPLAASRETIATLFAEREASYRLADWSVDASGTSPERLARQIQSAARSRGIVER